MLAALVQAQEAAVAVQAALTEAEAEAQAAAVHDYTMLQALEVAEQIRSHEDDTQILRDELGASEAALAVATLEAAAHRRRRRRRRRR